MMKQIETKRYSADVLVVGGGLSGLTAAIKVKELSPELNVLVVDKATAGASGGKANKGAGIFSYMRKDQDPDPFVRYHSGEIGGWLNDQLFMRKVYSASPYVIDDLMRWGVKFSILPDGSIMSFTIDPKGRWVVSMMDHDMVDKLKATAAKMGIKFVNKTQISELLTDNGRVVGAVGFNITDGTYTVCTAKATVLSCGSCDYMYTYMWSTARGDGLGAAYRAGAQLRGCEFANFYNIALKGNRMNINGPGSLSSLYNSKGERLLDKYGSPDDPDVSIGLLRGMVQEIEEGNGPIVHHPEDMIAMPKTIARPVQEKFYEVSGRKEQEYTLDKAEHPEVTLNFLGEFSALRVDHDLRTTLPGLWATGDTCYVGSGLSGACPAPPACIRGTGLMFAAVSSVLAAPSVVEYAKGAADVVCPEDQVAEHREGLYAPLERTGGPGPRELIFELKNHIAQPFYSVTKSEKYMSEGLACMTELRRQAAEEVCADGNFHLLSLCQDLKNMSLCGQLYYEASLAREESRGFHFRKDHPERDDENFLKWSLLNLVEGKNCLSYESVPMEDYPFHPWDVEEVEECVGESDVNGKWKISIVSPIGTEEALLELFVDGSTMTGTMTDSSGAHELRNGKVDGAIFSADLTLILDMFGPTEFTIEGTVNGTKVSGYLNMAFSKSSFEGNRLGM